MTKSTKRPKVFLSYESRDSGVANTIADALKLRNIDVWNENMFHVGDPIQSRLQQVTSTSDYIILILSSNFVNSSWSRRELDLLTANQILDRRGITLLPVLISDVRIPPSIERYRFYDCRQSLESKLQELADRISAIPEIDFSKLGGKEFEDLVSDLMIKLRFTNIRKRVRVKDFEFDIKADYLRKDPFGVSTSETWLTECKLYKHSRVDLKTIKQFLFLLSTLDSSCYGLLVMNNQLTSVAEEYLEKLKSEYGKEIRVIDGPELKRLLLEYTDLIQKYFSSKDPEKNEPGL